MLKEMTVAINCFSKFAKIEIKKPTIDMKTPIGPENPKIKSLFLLKDSYMRVLMDKLLSFIDSPLANLLIFMYQ